MTVTVRLFARAKDLVGKDAVCVSLPDGATVGELRRRLGDEHRQLTALLARSAFAVNDEFADDAQQIPAEAVVALLPPVSGGT